MAAKRIIDRRCEVCRANLSAVKTSIGWRCPPQVRLNISVMLDAARETGTRTLHFCVECASFGCLAAAYDRLVEQTDLKLGEKVTHVA